MRHMRQTVVLHQRWSRYADLHENGAETALLGSRLGDGIHA